MGRWRALKLRSVSDPYNPGREQIGFIFDNATFLQRVIPKVVSGNSSPLQNLDFSGFFKVRSSSPRLEA